MPTQDRAALNLTRRGFLAIASGTGASVALAACTPSANSANGGKVSGSSSAIVSGTQPPGWHAVSDRLNSRLKKDLGVTLDIEFLSFSNYVQQTLLKFTGGAKFDTALEALWASLSQLEASHSIVNLAGKLTKYPHLKATLPQRLLDSNTTLDGLLPGVPQANSAARMQHFTIREDLAKSLGYSTIEDFSTLERYLYAVKKRGVVPFGVSNSQNTELVFNLYNEEYWSNPNAAAYSFGASFSGTNFGFIFANDCVKTGRADPKPFWDDDSTIDTFRRMRRYYQDGILNADAINTDSATVTSRWASGAYGGVWAMTDGTSSNALSTLRKKVPEAAFANVMPLKGGLHAFKPYQTFQADNIVVINANGDLDRALAIQDWLSVQANHDLLEYGIEGKDWKQLSRNRYRQLSEYTFPGYALCWRPSLEKRSEYMSATEESIFDWAQDFNNFTVSPFAKFIPNITPVKSAVAQMSSAMTQYLIPLSYGLVDVDSQLDKLKSAADAAGLELLQAEMSKQADAYLKTAASSR
ncbi:ABC transporter substrate-binding protein [Humibacter sp.]|jgi:putative aldouronate transport system substrate-binding protein|uniref:ABC transporter substrate-binding protein n=1 Tax=Humibacter sp. TaxID=1940291 RepID=UPI002D115127|nr:ABC transporter substrate-binding protein [Humibacter sp.]HVX09131.1 ABC transporter substrate-binding protein [Humibacter sp.]